MVDDLTPREYDILIRGAFDYEYEMKESEIKYIQSLYEGLMNVLRVQIYSNVHTKGDGLTPEKMLPFPWDKKSETLKKSGKLTPEQIAELDRKLNRVVKKYNDGIN